MVTAKKVSTPKAVAVAPVAATKPVVAKKSAVKKTVSPAALVTPAPVTAVSEKPMDKPKAKAVKTTKASQTTPQTAAKAALSAEQRNNYVEVAAFYIAERRGFAPGNPADDWLAAEQEVDRLLASGQFNA
ncbi:MAG: DUF2934 domain-containing protein [Rhodoferax sp.]|uniref:DUF2934 domain-containing protein n=1 Tax=Rhodoferax sp. TaxID=50421 RepID=UPI0026379C2C|nr:DUF2934 domain-containing protein [Rhodoferax sp.]MDD2881377.1 DUF2934 domain-containing protein [Rhodoferax sp.]